MSPRVLAAVVALEVVVVALLVVPILQVSILPVLVVVAVGTAVIWFTVHGYRVSHSEK